MIPRIFKLKKISFLLLSAMMSAFAVQGQDAAGGSNTGMDSAVASKSAASRNPSRDSTFKPSGQLWGYAFGDFYYKAHSDNASRGGANQYTGIPAGRDAFQFRRIYLGYNYNISPKFAAEFLFAAEDNFSGGDLLANGKFTAYIKLADIRIKNIWKGTDLVVGEGATPAFPLLTEVIWGYRSIERTVSDIRRTPSFDFGASLQGKFDPDHGNFGYDLMVGNGSGDKPEGDNFKWFYGDVYAKFLDQKLVFDLYADYERLNWTPGFHHARNMVKAFAAYNTPYLTIGVEAFTNHGENDVVGNASPIFDTTSALSEAISFYIHGAIIKDRLNFFARMDNYNPDTKYDHVTFTKYTGLTSTYEPNNREQFIVAGLDFTPNKNVHFMPNVWYNRYMSQTAASNTDYDLVYRITFYYIYGK
ncbi:MAG TPA: hypothetical protein VMV20_00755 [Chitinophagaceae bacterium]|nr:hypothetical protein [Chitinophagaceae bacterium]